MICNKVVIRLCHTMSSLALNKLKKRDLHKVVKPKKKVDRFDNLSVEEVQKYTLPDILDMNLDIIFIGINPSLVAAYRGRYYAGPGNHFYKLLYESGLVSQFINFEQDYVLLKHGIGLTNIVTRPTRSSAELKKSEIKEGAIDVEEKIKYFKPKVAVFNGKCIYEVYANKSAKEGFNFGLQSECIGESAIWVVPSSSARCSNFPRMQDKLHFYIALKKYLSYLKKEIIDVDMKEFQFEGKCKPSIPSTSKMWRRKQISAFLYGGRIANKDTFCMDVSGENIAIAKSTEFIVNDKEGTCKVKNSDIEKKTDSMNKTTDVTTKIVPEVKVKSSLNEQKRNYISSTSKAKKKQVNNIKITQVSIHPNSNETNIKCNKRQSTLDFIGLIKQRISEKKFADDSLNEKGGVEDNSLPQETVVLKCENLKLNKCKKDVTAFNNNFDDSVFID